MRTLLFFGILINLCAALKAQEENSIDFKDQTGNLYGVVTNTYTDETINVKTANGEYIEVDFYTAASSYYLLYEVPLTAPQGYLEFTLPEGISYLKVEILVGDHLEWPILYLNGDRTYTYYTKIDDYRREVELNLDYKGEVVIKLKNNTTEINPAKGVIVDKIFWKNNIPTSVDYNYIDQIKIFPNPVVDKLNIKCELDIQEISICNIDGTIVKFITDTQNNIIDCSNLNSGIYLLSIVSVDGHEVVKKFIKK
ncbi:T9SS type A sorting domain-containing protein [Carboxylicivirga sp. RSCT41]|uniref:T9SS type A sorting domain-containing protein n=1 Tax=Carboxylicivirga agarovorans TaxID=3417570 RepID=UPI003D358CD0